MIMTGRPIVILLLTAAAVALFLTNSARRLSAAETDRNVAQTALHAVVRDAQEVVELRAMRQKIARAEHPTHDVIARINATLADAGLPLECMRGLMPEADLALTTDAVGSDRGGRYRTQSLHLTVQGLEPRELGCFLARWQATQPMWTVTRIDLTHERSRNSTSTRYDASIMLAAIYIADE
jgi:type II secretory pathway pseudopilin PulG